MRGHIVKRGKNSYSLKVSLGKDASTGKYKYQWVTVKGSKKDAEKRLSELLHQLDTSVYMKPGKTTVAEYLHRWLIDYAKPNLSPSTIEGYDQIIKHYVIPQLGDNTLVQLKPENREKVKAVAVRLGLI